MIPEKIREETIYTGNLAGRKEGKTHFQEQHPFGIEL